jgi:hypothetical protein
MKKAALGKAAFFLVTHYQPATIASTGHTDAHAPQSMQVSGSIHRALSFSLIALTGHSLSQVPQFVHASVTLYAICDLFM